jgi:hypothetical protein
MGISILGGKDTSDPTASTRSGFSQPVGRKKAHVKRRHNKIVSKNREKIVKKFLSANLRLVNIGLESGSERIRNEILNRPKHSNKEFI